MPKRCVSFMMLFTIVCLPGAGCARKSAMKLVEPLPVHEAIAGDAIAIIDSRTSRAISFETLVNDLADVRIVYIGESHADPAHHQVQLRLIRALFERHPDLSVGMEMFDRSYQGVLNRWSAGGMDFQQFLERTHWYANWKYDVGLYRDILEYVHEKNIPLVGLNIPFHIPPRIATGGIDSLLEDDRKYLPAHIDTANKAHRRFVENVFRFHRIPGREKFEYFYAAQCVWEDAMAEVIALDLNRRPMIVLAGRGHIDSKFGIPERAFKRTGEAYRTIVPGRPDAPASPDMADYIFFPEAVEEKALDD